MPVPRGVRALLLDIEGTTTPITFVYDVLFPFAAARVDDACATTSPDGELAAAIAQLREEYDAERSAGAATLPDFETGAPYAHYLMAQDRKSTGLKALQGLLWQGGYGDGELVSQVFPDVPPALRRWVNNGLRVRIFSSGSVLAQQLLFRHTDHGDLTPLLEGYHDTTTGPKRDPAAYAAIADAFGLPANTVLFLSDVVDELHAARGAGMATGLSIRPGNRPAPVSDHPSYRTFDEL